MMKIIILCVIVLIVMVLFLPSFPQRKNEEFFAKYKHETSESLPLFYRNEYNISFWGLENLHPFDSKKYSRVHKYLLESKLFDSKNFTSPPQPDQNLLEKFHTKDYLKQLKSSSHVARITEVAVAGFLPGPTVKKNVLDPMLYAVGGTLMATRAALDVGRAINLGGGFHHASREYGHGFCVYNDITMAIEMALDDPRVNKVLYIDLDAHQGDGPSTDFKGREDVYLVDFYNKMVFPNDAEAQKGIDRSVEFGFGVKGEKYLAQLEEVLSSLSVEFDLLVYNAGTDILSGDPLGGLDVDKESIIQRDAMVFEFAYKNKIPIVMLLSGGYQKNNARIIADSIINISSKLSP